MSISDGDHHRAGEHALVDLIEPERFSPEALQGVYQLNRALIELLVASANRPVSEAQPHIVVHLGPALLALGSAARERLACCPTALVDFGFRNVEFWRQIESGQPPSSTQWSLQGCFPRLQAIELAQTALTLAWTWSQSSREAATLIFGLAPECATTLVKVGIQAIPHIAETYAHCGRPRWETDIGFWRELIRIAQAADSPMQPRLPPIGVYALQRQFADLLFPGLTCNS